MQTHPAFAAPRKRRSSRRPNTGTGFARAKHRQGPQVRSRVAVLGRDEEDQSVRRQRIDFAGLKEELAPSLAFHRSPRPRARASWSPKWSGAVEHASLQPLQVSTGQSSAWRCARRGLTPRSSRAPTAKRQARATVHVIICSAGLAFHRWVRLNSNVRQRKCTRSCSHALRNLPWLSSSPSMPSRHLGRSA